MKTTTTTTYLLRFAFEAPSSLTITGSAVAPDGMVVDLEDGPNLYRLQDMMPALAPVLPEGARAITDDERSIEPRAWITSSDSPALKELHDKVAVVKLTHVFQDGEVTDTVAVLLNAPEPEEEAPRKKYRAHLTTTGAGMIKQRSFPTGWSYSSMPYSIADQAIRAATRPTPKYFDFELPADEEPTVERVAAALKIRRVEKFHTHVSRVEPLADA